MNRQSRCRGLLGWVLGHKFKYTDHAMYTHLINYCLRCGMPRDALGEDHE